jgi:hypothetical protein
MSIPLGDQVHSADNPATVRIDYVNYEAPVTVRFRVTRADGAELTYMLSRDGDTVFLHFEEGTLGMFYHEQKPVREYFAELLALRARVTIEDPFGIQNKTFAQIAH